MTSLAAVSASEQLRAKASEVKTGLKELGALAPEAAREKFNALRESAAECCAETKERAKEAGENVTDFIRERPLQSVMIAAGAGLLIGLLLKRR